LGIKRVSKITGTLLKLQSTKERNKMKKNIKIIAQALMAAGIISTSGFSNAQASIATGPNNVYIEQVGNSNTITIQQVGGTNNVGGVAVDALTVDSTGLTTLTATAPSATNYGTISGNTNTLAITQTGSANSAQYNIRGNNNAYTSTVTGDSNKTKLTIGDQANATNLRNTVTETISGNSNIVIQDLIGNDIASTTTISGNSNEVTKELKNTNGTSVLSITGGNNVINAQQIDAAGANGHYLNNVIVGSYNSITTQQQGSNDTTFDIKTTGDHNTITVRSSSSSITAPVAAIAR
jgi:hypothetical protein